MEVSNQLSATNSPELGGVSEPRHHKEIPRGTRACGRREVSRGARRLAATACDPRGTRLCCAGRARVLAGGVVFGLRQPRLHCRGRVRWVKGEHNSGPGIIQEQFTVGNPSGNRMSRAKARRRPAWSVAPELVGRGVGAAGAEDTLGS